MRSMTPEERFERIERQLEFLATHQAQLSVSLETLRDVVARHDSQIVHLTDVVVSLAHIVEEQGRRFEQQGQRMDEGFARLTEAQRRTDEQGRRTDERLNALINVVERYFSNGRK